MRRILIVDGDPRICQAIHETLSVIRHVVFFAFDAVSAVSEARKHNPDLIIVDLNLPVVVAFLWSNVCAGSRFFCERRLL